MNKNTTDLETRYSLAKLFGAKINEGSEYILVPENSFNEVICFMDSRDVNFSSDKPDHFIIPLPEINYNFLTVLRRKLINTQELKVKYLNTLRATVSKKCPKNKMGAPLVSDYNLLDAEPEEICEAILKVFEKK